MRRRKRGQIQTQVFVYILSLVLAGLLLMFGYKAISGFVETEEFVELLRFKIEIKNMFKEIRGNYGDATLKTLSVPDGYTEICAVDIRPTRLPGAFETELPNHPIISDSVETGAEQNLFVIDQNTKITMHAFFVGNISLKVNNAPKDSHCFKVQGGTVKMRLEALGDRVEVSNW